MDASERHEKAAKYMPTPEEIKAACKAIQEEWLMTVTGTK